MKEIKRPHQLLQLLGLILIAALFLALYFFPSLIYINRTRREAADRREALHKYQGGRDSFILFQEREKELLRRLQEASRASFFPLSHSSGEEQLLETFQSHIREESSRLGLAAPEFAVQRLHGEEGISILVARFRIEAVPAKLFRFCESLLAFPYRLMVKTMEFNGDSTKPYWDLEIQLFGFSGKGTPPLFDLPPIDPASPQLTRVIEDMPSDPPQPAEFPLECPGNRFSAGKKADGKIP